MRYMELQALVKNTEQGSRETLSSKLEKLSDEELMVIVDAANSEQESLIQKSSVAITPAVAVSFLGILITLGFGVAAIFLGPMYLIPSLVGIATFGIGIPKILRHWNVLDHSEPMKFIEELERVIPERLNAIRGKSRETKALKEAKNKEQVALKALSTYSAKESDQVDSKGPQKELE